ncbi:hypothetical protein GH714_010522 [Hevea brasiliensis]|uniref:F-box domain-containing protein n=1 Tax=Hevea brasiliensis TaxID=3981 RepID=A0A6A6MXU7_HEVBR|nr:hypothetical protein GH714_010522 [Hevea brasiliensis]
MLVKTCCSCIDSPDFIYLHLNRSIKTRTNRSLIIDEIKPKGSIFAVDLDSSDRCPVELHRPHKTFVDTVESVYDSITKERIVRPRKFYSDVFGSCNGLLAMYNANGISLWNQSTKKHQIIPKFWNHDEYDGCDKILVGFGHDSINNDYKSLIICDQRQFQAFEEFQSIVSPMKFDYDIFIEILCRLPIETLLRFRCLSKRCCSFIDSPDFINLHLNRSIKTSTNRSLIIDEIKPEGSIFAVDLDSSDRCPVELHRPHKPFAARTVYDYITVATAENVYYDIIAKERIFRPRKFSSDVFGSCNGLLAMYNGNGMSLWNPSTKKHQILPKFWSHDECNVCDRITVGFGYDSINNDYKVIMMFQHKGMSLHYIKNPKIRVMVYSLKEKRVDNVILAFDLGNEKFCELPKPHSNGYEVYCLRVAELRGSLAISCSCMGTAVEVWVMKEYGITESWTKLFRIYYEQLGISDLSTSYLKPLCYSKTGDEVLLDDQYGVYSVLYDLEQKSAKRVTIFRSPPEPESEIPVKISANICVRSLVPVNLILDCAAQDLTTEDISSRSNKDESPLRRNKDAVFLGLSKGVIRSEIRTLPSNSSKLSTTEIRHLQGVAKVIDYFVGGSMHLSEESLGLVIGLETVHTVWSALKDAYAQDSQEREFTLRQQLTYFRKDENRSITEHLRLFKELCDSLAAIGKKVPDEEKVFCLLTSLGPQYETFTTTMLKPPRPNFNELNSSSNSSNRRPRFNSQGRGFQAQQTQNPFPNKESYSSQRRPPPAGRRRMTPAERELYKNEVCQYCNRDGHIAKICWWIPQEKQSSPAQALSALTLDTDVVDTDWVADSGASNHMTGNKNLFHKLTDYYGPDSITIGDGTFLSIDGVGMTSIEQKQKLSLSNVFSVPALKKNLLSVGQLTDDYPVNCEFSNVSISVKDRQTGQLMDSWLPSAEITDFPLSSEESAGPDVLPVPIPATHDNRTIGDHETESDPTSESPLAAHHSHSDAVQDDGMHLEQAEQEQLSPPPLFLSNRVEDTVQNSLAAEDVVGKQVAAIESDSVFLSSPTNTHVPGTSMIDGTVISLPTVHTDQEELLPEVCSSSLAEISAEQVQDEALQPRHSMVTRSQSGIVKPNPNLADPSLFVMHTSTGVLVLLIYVDDMLLTGSSMALVQNFLQVLSKEFSMKDLGPLHHFLGIQIQSTDSGLQLNQTRYAYSILERAQMVDCQPMPTPLVQRHDAVTDPTPVADPTFFRGLVGSLQYLTLTRPDLSYSVNYISQFMHSPTLSHLKYVRRILRYLKGTIHFGLFFKKDTSLVLSAFSDADWAGCPTTRRSTTGYCTFLGCNIISWCAKKQHTVARSSTEAEYRSMAHTAAELTWLGYLLQDLQIYPKQPPILYGDNLSALHLTVNPVLHSRSKHVALDYHYVRERVAQGVLITRYIPSAYQIADIFTKSMTKARLAQFRRKLCLHPGHSLRGDINSRSNKDESASQEK